MAEIGDLITYRPLTGGPVKGIVNDRFKDVDGEYLCFLVTSIHHPTYPKGMEVVTTVHNGYIETRRRNDR